MAIENIQKKEEVKTSKIQKAFKKMKNAFIVGTAALMITCGGEDTSSNDNGGVKKLPIEIEQYADQNNYETYSLDKNTQHFLYGGGVDEGINPLFSKFIDICKKSDLELNVSVSEDDRLFYTLDNVTSVSEMILQNHRDRTSFEIATQFKYNNKKYLLGGYAPTFKFMFDSLDETETTYMDMWPSGFNYLMNKDALTTKDPYLLECYARYIGEDYSDHKFFTRIKVIPQDVLNQMITDSGVSMDYFYERVKQTIEQSQF